MQMKLVLCLHLTQSVFNDFFFKNLKSKFILLFKTTNEITVCLMLENIHKFGYLTYPIEIIDFSQMGRALKILVSAVRFCLWPPLQIHQQDIDQIQNHLFVEYPFD